MNSYFYSLQQHFRLVGISESSGFNNRKTYFHKFNIDCLFDYSIRKISLEFENNSTIMEPEHH